jgi:hypothetical protein
MIIFCVKDDGKYRYHCVLKDYFSYLRLLESKFCSRGDDVTCQFRLLHHELLYILSTKYFVSALCHFNVNFYF